MNAMIATFTSLLLLWATGAASSGSAAVERSRVLERNLENILFTSAELHVVLNSVPSTMNESDQETFTNLAGEFIQDHIKMPDFGLIDFKVMVTSQALLIQDSRHLRGFRRASERVDKPLAVNMVVNVEYVDSNGERIDPADFHRYLRLLLNSRGSDLVLKLRRTGIFFFQNTASILTFSSKSKSVSPGSQSEKTTIHAGGMNSSTIAIVTVAVVAVALLATVVTTRCVRTNRYKTQRDAESARKPLICDELQDRFEETQGFFYLIDHSSSESPKLDANRKPSEGPPDFQISPITHVPSAKKSSRSSSSQRTTSKTRILHTDIRQRLELAHSPTSTGVTVDTTTTYSSKSPECGISAIFIDNSRKIPLQDDDCVENEHISCLGAQSRIASEDQPDFMRRKGERSSSPSPLKEQVEKPEIEIDSHQFTIRREEGRATASPGPHGSGPRAIDSSDGRGQLISQPLNQIELCFDGGKQDNPSLLDVVKSNRTMSHIVPSDDRLLKADNKVIAKSKPNSDGKHRDEIPSEDNAESKPQLYVALSSDTRLVRAGSQGVDCLRLCSSDKNQDERLPVSTAESKALVDLVVPCDEGMLNGGNQVVDISRPRTSGGNIDESSAVENLESTSQENLPLSSNVGLLSTVGLEAVDKSKLCSGSENLIDEHSSVAKSESNPLLNLVIPSDDCVLMLDETLKPKKKQKKREGTRVKKAKRESGNIESKQNETTIGRPPIDVVTRTQGTVPVDNSPIVTIQSNGADHDSMSSISETDSEADESI